MRARLERTGIPEFADQLTKPLGQQGQLVTRWALDRGVVWFAQKVVSQGRNGAEGWKMEAMSLGEWSQLTSSTALE